MKTATTNKLIGAAWLSVVISIVGLGCDGRTFIGSGAGMGGAGGNPTASGGTNGGGPDGSGGTPVGGAGGTQAVVVDAGPGDAGPDGAPSTCPTAGELATPATVDALRAALSRAWLLCSPLGLTNNAQVGLLITTDDRYALLERDASGAVVAAHGVDFEGSITYMVIDPNFGGGIQVNFTSDLGGTVISRPVITTSPTELIINNNGVYEYRYITADGS
jgi:hypothetical protein